MTTLQRAILQHGSHHKHTGCLVTNKKPRPAKGKNILRMDPTRTTLLRNKFMAEVRLRFRRLRIAVKDFMVTHDALGLKQHRFVMHGGSGSGNFGHEGRAGEVGGSGASGLDKALGETEEARTERLAAKWIHRYSWDKTLRSMPNVAVDQYLKQFRPTSPVTLYRFEHAGHDPSKSEIAPNIYLQSWSHDRAMVEGIAESLNTEHPDSTIVKSQIFQPHEIYTDFTRFPAAFRAAIEKHGGESSMKEVLVYYYKKSSPTTHAAPQPGQYKFLTSDKKLDAFNKWFKQQVDEDIIKPVGPSGAFAPSLSAGPWTNKYVESAYKKGALNAYLDAKKQDLGTQTDFSRQSQEQFLRESFAAPETASKIALIGTRTWENMKGVTDTMGTQMNQILAQGLIDGSGADEIAADMVDTIDGLTDTRALVIARTEIIHAHAEGQLDSFADLGIEELGVNVEWSTAGDDRVCPECEDMEGKTFTVDEARGLIPLHPSCRCSWTPSESKK